MTHQKHNIRRDGVTIYNALCLTGDGHRRTTDHKPSVDCPRCLRVRALMDSGMTHQQAVRQQLDEQEQMGTTGANHRSPFGPGA